jgi:hypothetical protein
MPKRNREILMQQSLYDLLVKINTGMLAGYDCIMDVFDDAPESVAKRCGENGANCEKCLQSWMNEYPF